MHSNNTRGRNTRRKKKTHYNGLEEPKKSNFSKPKPNADERQVKAEGDRPPKSRNTRSRSKSRGGKQQKRPVGLQPEQLVKLASEPAAETFVPSWTYEEAHFQPALKHNLRERNYTSPTPIQEKAIPPIMEGRNVLGIADTGTGKTAAFLIPIIEQLLQHDKVRPLIIVPTRELALQVMEEFRALAKGTPLYCSAFIGGTNVRSDINRAGKLNHLVVGTPGRLLDLSNQRALHFDRFTTLVIDEFDRMLDMGFITDVEKIMDGMTNKQQTLLFSATIDKKIKPLVEGILQDPVEVALNHGGKTTSMVDQDIVRVAQGQEKSELLYDLIAAEGESKVLVFAETKRNVDKVGKMLNKSGMQAEVIHGDKSQNYRIKALKNFSSGKVKVLVATDVAARGIDVSDIALVINYEMPRTMDSYIHRIGRTGRAGKKRQSLHDSRITLTDQIHFHSSFSGGVRMALNLFIQLFIILCCHAVAGKSGHHIIKRIECHIQPLLIVVIVHGHDRIF